MSVHYWPRSNKRLLPRQYNCIITAFYSNAMSEHQTKQPVVAKSSETKPKDPLIEAPQKDLKEEQFVNHILHVIPKDVNVKFIFDHIRNYGIAGGMAWVGAKILKQTSCTPDCFVALLDFIAGGSLLGLGVVLFFINVVHGIAATAAVQDFQHVRKWPFTIVTLLIILIAVKLVWFGSPS